MSEWKIFGERLRSEIERQEISQRQLADKSGIPLATICRYVHSQRVPRATEILRLAKILHVTCDYMLGLSDDPHKTRDGWTKGAPLHDNDTDYIVKETNFPLATRQEVTGELIRCKDCKWRDDPAHWLGCPILNTNDNNYCSFAERSTDERYDKRSGN